ncbi:non-lysosomal ceramidase [Acrasis kona]|uniref:Neutral ceramidase n=1 Tax=Acrasis kona TaxID=1008807 RepID=A0AAW2YKM1_9EUKA
MISQRLVVILLLCTFLYAAIPDADNNYRIGVGSYDMTGPAAEVGMMGYAMVGQRTHGIHFRLRARAFVIADRKSDADRIVYVNTDTCMTTQAVKLTVADRIQKKYPDTLGKYYNNDNIAISATHSHAGVGGYAWYTMYDMTTFGFEKANFEVVVDGIIAAIKQAHDNLSQGGRILLNQGKLGNDSNINRSPTAYLRNPADERARYEDGNTDKIMTNLRFEDQDGFELGMLNWFPVHGTSMTNTNKFISGDNKGFASYVVERKKDAQLKRAKGRFIAAFGQTNEGDVSPNTRGPSCPDGITPCAEDSTCQGKTQLCTAKGPGKDEFDSTKIIGEKQAVAAMKLYDDVAGSIVLSGPVRHRHTFVNMSSTLVKPEYTSTGKIGTTCRAAMGYSFAAGTTDGPGDFNFKQGMNKTGNPFWDYISSFVAKPTEEQKACQAPKPILLDVGQTEPLPWVPDVLPIQMFSIGSLAILSLPAELTTMSGRRVKEVIHKTLVKNNPTQFSAEKAKVVIAGLSNAYSGYVTTFEEYTAQRYEGASTMYGPHTLAAYTQEMDKLAFAIANNQAVPAGPAPLNLTDRVWSFNPGVVVDTHPSGKPFGSIHVDVDTTKTYKTGEAVTAEFWSAHPKNHLMTEQTFSSVERRTGDGPNDFEVVVTDHEWDTTFKWTRVWIAQSTATITWKIGETIEIQPGMYRIRHFGVSKDLFGTRTPFVGSSSEFKVVA